MNTREQIVVNDSGFSSQISSETIDPGYTIGCKDGYVTVTYESNLIGTAATSQGLREIFINNGITESSEIHWGDSLDHAEKNGFSTEFEVFRLVMEAL
ncbi:MAG: hypothetical protein RI942_2496, partial [Pseudomonadota bacterium]